MEEVIACNNRLQESGVVYASDELSKSGTSAKVFSGNVIQEVDKNSGCNKVLQNNTTDDVQRRLISEKKIMFEKSNISVGDVVVEMIMGLACRYSLVLEARQKSFECFQICAGPELQSFRISNYMLSKIYDPPEEKIKLHFYCLQCTTPLLITSRQSFVMVDFIIKLFKNIPML